MIINIEDFACPPSELHDCCICFGVFDGIHSGHKFEFMQCQKEAKEFGKKSGILTFNIDPDEIFKNDFCKLMTNDQRIYELDKSGCDFVFVLDYLQIKNLSDKDFLNGIFSTVKPWSLHVGKNFRYGAKATGDETSLVRWGKTNNVKVFVNDLITKDGHIESSTYYRNKFINSPSS